MEENKHSAVNFVGGDIYNVGDVSHVHAIKNFLSYFNTEIQEEALRCLFEDQCSKDLYDEKIEQLEDVKKECGIVEGSMSVERGRVIGKLMKMIQDKRDAIFPPDASHSLRQKFLPKKESRPPAFREDLHLNQIFGDKKSRQSEVGARQEALRYPGPQEDVNWNEGFFNQVRGEKKSGDLSEINVRGSADQSFENTERVNNLDDLLDQAVVIGAWGEDADRLIRQDFAHQDCEEWRDSALSFAEKFSLLFPHFRASSKFDWLILGQKLRKFFTMLDKVEPLHCVTAYLEQDEIDLLGDFLRNGANKEFQFFQDTRVQDIRNGAYGKVLEVLKAVPQAVRGMFALDILGYARNGEHEKREICKQVLSLFDSGELEKKDKPYWEEDGYEEALQLQKELDERDLDDKNDAFKLQQAGLYGPLNVQNQAVFLQGEDNARIVFNAVKMFSQEEIDSIIAGKLNSNEIDQILIKKMQDVHGQKPESMRCRVWTQLKEWANRWKNGMDRCQKCLREWMPFGRSRRSHQD